MKTFNVSAQIALPIGKYDSKDWFIQFRGIGSLRAYSPEAALRAAKQLGWRAPAISAVESPQDALPPLAFAPMRGFQIRKALKEAPPLPVRYLRIPRKDWK